MDREALLKEDAEAQLLREAEERRFLYRDVEELISTGFLTYTFTVKGVTLVFRSLSPSDFVRLQARTQHLREHYPALSWTLASSVWMINGYEISRDPKDNAAFHLRELFGQLHSSLLDVLGNVVTSFTYRVSRAVRLTEAFCYETYSRSLWRMQGSPAGRDARDDSVVRRMWVAYNQVEDLDQEDQRLWSHTRTVVGSMSNKGAKYITTELKKAADKEKTRRQAVIESAVNWVIRGDERKKPLKVILNGKEVEVPVIHSAQTQEDLEDEMRKVFTGEKDYHDLIVDQYQKSVKQRVLAKREERQRMILEARRLSEEAEERGQAPVVGYTANQLKELRPDIKPRTTAFLPASAQTNYLFDRYFNPDLKPGVLTPNLQVEDPSRDDPRQKTPAHTKEKGEITLQEKIERRQPKLNEP